MAEFILIVGLVTLVLAGLLYIAFGVLFGRVIELSGQVRALSIRDSRTRLPARSDGMLTYGRALCFVLAALTFVVATSSSGATCR